MTLDRAIGQAKRFSWRQIKTHVEALLAAYVSVVEVWTNVVVAACASVVEV